MGVQFNGTNRIICGTGGNVTGATMSISAWVKLTQNPDPLGIDYRVIMKGISGGTGDNVYGLSIGQASVRPQFRIRIGGTQAITTLAGVGTLVIGQWYHLVGSYTGSEVQIWTDGVLQSDTNAPAGAIDTSADQVWIGDQPTTANRQMRGVIADVRIYNRILNIDEINTILNARGGDYAAMAGAPLLHRWPLNDGAPGNVVGGVTDVVGGLSGQGNNSPTFSDDILRDRRRRPQPRAVLL